MRYRLCILLNSLSFAIRSADNFTPYTSSDVEGLGGMGGVGVTCCSTKVGIVPIITAPSSMMGRIHT